jgi:hypothetical protein
MVLMSIGIGFISQLSYLGGPTVYHDQGFNHDLSMNVWDFTCQIVV